MLHTLTRGRKEQSGEGVTNIKKKAPLGATALPEGL